MTLRFNECRDEERSRNLAPKSMFFFFCIGDAEASWKLGLSSSNVSIELTYVSAGCGVVHGNIYSASLCMVSEEF